MSIKKITNLHEEEIKNRVMDKIKLSGPAWKALLDDFKNGESKRVICFKYKIPTGYYKWIKKIVLNGK